MSEPVAASSSAHPVLVVDDDVLVRALIADILRDADLIVIECSDAEEALDILRSGTAVALLFSDVRMTGSMDGVRLAKIARSEYPDLKIALTSAERLPKDACCDAFYPKPWDSGHVTRGIKSLLVA
jgi:two-component system, response regulator PdtaR